MKISKIIPLCSLLMISAYANADFRQYPSNPVVNQDCIRNVLILQAVSSDIYKEAQRIKSLIDSHFWIGGEKRGDLISFVQKISTDYKTNSDFIFNNSKVKIVNDYLKQECLTTTQDKINEANDDFTQLRNLRIAIELTIANTDNIMKKNNCNVEEACAKELAADLKDRLNPPTEPKLDKVEIKEETTKSVAVVQNKKNVKKTFSSKVDYKVCED